MGRIALSLCGTALIAGAFMANCRSESVTGPVTSAHTSGGDVTSGGGSSPSGSSHSLLDYNGKTVTTDYELADENQCNGEAVPVKGTMSVTFFVSSIDVTHIKWQTHLVVDGTGSLGNVYHGDDQFLDETNVSILPMEETIEHNVSMHSSTAPDYRSKYLFHITISGTGEPSAGVDKGPNDSCSK